MARRMGCDTDPETYGCGVSGLGQNAQMVVTRGRWQAMTPQQKCDFLAKRRAGIPAGLGGLGAGSMFNPIIGYAQARASARNAYVQAGGDPNVKLTDAQVTAINQAYYGGARTSGPGPGNPKYTDSLFQRWMNPFYDDGSEGYGTFGPIKNPKALAVDALIAFVALKLLKSRKRR